MQVQTKYQMEVNPERLDSLRQMILHDSFMHDIGNGMVMRVVRVIGGLMYIYDKAMIYTPFGHSYTKEYEQNGQG